MLLRLHFHAGVFVAPFLLLAALTGLAYTLTPQLDRLVYGDLLTVVRAVGEPRPLAAQLAVARTAHPEGRITSVITPAGPEDTTRLVLSVCGNSATGSARCTSTRTPPRSRASSPRPGAPRRSPRGSTTCTAICTWARSAGWLYSEAAAGWLWVIAAGGLALWFGRTRRPRRGARRFLLPERSARGMRRTRGLHATLGIWLAVGLFFLSATGLTWSAHAGGRALPVLGITLLGFLLADAAAGLAKRARR